MEIEVTKKSLIAAFETGNLNLFKSTFFSDKVKIEASSKEDFFYFFQERIKSAHYKVKGGLYLKIRLPEEGDEFTEAYDFYSRNHLYSRLSIHIVETIEFIEIDVIPF